MELWIIIAASCSAILVFFSVYMKTMKKLRIFAILANMASLVYAFLGGVIPLIILHLLLLPINLFRLYQMIDLEMKMEAAAKEGYDFSALIPMMTMRKFKAGHTIFNFEESANEFYIVKSGRIYLPEYEVELGEGCVLGEIGIFSEDNRRTSTARAVTDVVLYEIDEVTIRQLFFENPDLAIYLTKLIIRRMKTNFEHEHEKLVAKLGS